MTQQNNSDPSETPFAIAMITEDGLVNWIVSENITKEQEKTFKKIYAVTEEPSIVLIFFLKLEIFLLNFLILLQNMFKGKNNEQ